MKTDALIVKTPENRFSVWLMEGSCEGCSVTTHSTWDSVEEAVAAVACPLLLKGQKTFTIKFEL